MLRPQACSCQGGLEQEEDWGHWLGERHPGRASCCPKGRASFCGWATILNKQAQCLNRGSWGQQLGSGVSAGWGQAPGRKRPSWLELWEWWEWNCVEGEAGGQAWHLQHVNCWCFGTLSLISWKPVIPGTVIWSDLYISKIAWLQRNWREWAQIGDWCRGGGESLEWSGLQQHQGRWEDI